jgi:response regulator NasT
MRLRVLLVDERPERQELVAELLAGADCELLRQVGPGDDLLRAVQAHDPDLVIIDIDSPGRDTLENLRTVQATAPRPMVMFSQDDAGDTIRRAVEAGVSAYVVDGLQAKRVRPVIEAAMARFRQYRALEQELDRTRSELQARKLIDRAKGIVMQQRGVGEPEAYQLLRKAAMDRNKRLVEIAEAIISADELLHGPGVSRPR